MKVSKQSMKMSVLDRAVCRQLLGFLGKLQELMYLRTGCSVPYKTDPLG